MTNIYGKGAKGKATKLHSLLVRSLAHCENIDADGNSCEYSCECHRDDMSHERGCKLEAAHIVSRTYGFTRTLTCNAYSLCSMHHAEYTKWPREFSKYITRTFAQDIYEDMRFQSRQYHKVDWDDRLAVLQSMKDRGLTLEQMRQEDIKYLKEQ